MVPSWVGTIDDDGDDGSTLTTGADSFQYLAGHLVSMGVPFEVLDPPELREHLLELADRLVANHPTPAGS
jgi:predicted DNA-binding transcriptional regulator YafY